MISAEPEKLLYVRAVIPTPGADTFALVFQMITLHNGLPTTTELRAIVGRYWGARRAEIDATLRQLATTDPDEDVLDILAEPFTSVEDVSRRLTQCEEHLREREDRRSVFLTVYTRMTAAVRSGIQFGFFVDADWVREYLVTFAEHYRRALIAFERREFEAVPEPWRIGFCASIKGDTLVAQDALLGINAHINYDLSYTLQEVSIDPDRDDKRVDHDRINDILYQLVDVVQEVLTTVYSAAGVAEIDALLGQMDEQLALLGLEQSRQFAWRNAVLLTDLSWTRRYVDWRVRTVSTGAAYFVLEPRIDPTTRTRLRRVEADTQLLRSFYEEFDRRAAEAVPE